MATTTRFDADRAARYALNLWTRDTGSWAEDASGQIVSDPMAPIAVSFNRAGAIIRAIEEQIGRGRTTNRQFVAVAKRVPVTR